MVEIKIKKLNSSVEIPQYPNELASGVDLKANVDYSIAPGISAVIPTGLAVSIPEGYEIQIRSKANLAMNNSVSVLNSPGTIDSFYTEEIKVILINHSRSTTFHISKGDSIARLVLQKVEQIEFVEDDFE